MNDSRHLLLIPSGSSRERIHGISHLLEHLLLIHLYENTTIRNPDFSGSTSEDYILVAAKETDSEKLLKALLRFTPDEERFFQEKKNLLYEIDVKEKGESESFFRSVWQDSVYERSPLGTRGEIEALSFPEFKEFVEQVQADTVYLYAHPGRVTVMRRMDAEPLIKPKKHWRRAGGYSFFYFNFEVELRLLVSAILQLFNPDKHIQISEKRECSALIMEGGVSFPPPSPASAAEGAGLRLEARRMGQAGGRSPFPRHPGVGKPLFLSYDMEGAPGLFPIGLGARPGAGLPGNRGGGEWESLG